MASKIPSEATIPGPPLPAVVQSALFVARPFQFIASCRGRYGDVVRLRLSGQGEYICLFDPEAIREVFAADGDAAHAGAANAGLEPVVGAHSILTIDRDEHLRRRRLVSPVFHGETLKRAEPTIESIVEEELSEWPRERPFPLRPAMQKITFRVVAHLVLGRDDPSEVARLVKLFEPVMGISPLFLISWLRLDLGPISPWGRFVRAQARLDRELAEIIKKRRSQPSGPDLLGVLIDGMEAEDQQANSIIRDDLISLLVAGHETTATALSWAFERLARAEEIQEKARQAARGDDSAYLDAVAQETLRLRPIVSDVGRVLDRPLQVGSRTLPAGAHVRLSIAAVQGDARHFPAPEEFRPERFLDSKPDRLIWLPFGGGRRRCLGAALAQLEMRIVLRKVLAQREALALDPLPERPVMRGPTYVPNRGALVQLASAGD